MHVGVAQGEERLERRLDAQLLADFTPRAGLERLARGEHTADRHVPVPGVDVLGRGALVDEELAAAIEDEDVRGPVRQAPGTHLPARDDADELARIVHHVDQLGVRRRHDASSKRPPTAASSSGVLTLVRLRAAPRTARISVSLT